MTSYYRLSPLTGDTSIDSRTLHAFLRYILLQQRSEEGYRTTLSSYSRAKSTFHGHQAQSRGSVTDPEELGQVSSVTALELRELHS